MVSFVPTSVRAWALKIPPSKKSRYLGTCVLLELQNLNPSCIGLLGFIGILYVFPGIKLGTNKIVISFLKLLFLHYFFYTMMTPNDTLFPFGFLVP